MNSPKVDLLVYRNEWFEFPVNTLQVSAKVNLYGKTYFVQKLRYTDDRGNVYDANLARR